jgi:ppGpp synthetase/RelA/SpoT-type nucleotidyltranferase
LPYAATGQKDAVDADGKIIPQAVDYSKLTPILIKAIQEQDIKIKEQEGKILKLNNQKDSIEKRVSDLESLIKKLIKKNN